MSKLDTPEHEFDWLKGTSYDTHSRHTEVAPFGGEPPHRPHKETVPKEAFLEHDIAPKGAKPPLNLFRGMNHLGDDLYDGSIEDMARKQLED